MLILILNLPRNRVHSVQASKFDWRVCDGRTDRTIRLGLGVIPCHPRLPPLPGRLAPSCDLCIRIGRIFCRLITRLEETVMSQQRSHTSDCLTGLVEEPVFLEPHPSLEDGLVASPESACSMDRELIQCVVG